MTLGTTSEEIFRFSVVRNPEAIPANKMQDRAVNIVPDGAGKQYKYFTALAALRKKGTPRNAILAQAQRMMDAPEFKDNLNNLNTPLWNYVDRLQQLSAPIFTDAKNLIREVFGKVAGDLAVDDIFQADIVTVSDSLVLVSTVTPSTPGLRTRLMQARRAIAFILRLSAEPEADASGAEKLLDAALLLPVEIFPLPDNRKEKEEENNKAYIERKTALEKKSTQAQTLLNELSKNTAASDELSATLSRHLFETLHPTDENNRPASSLSVLPPDKVKNLSPSVKKIVLDQLNIPSNAVDVPFVIDQLEKNNLKLGQDLTTKFGDLLTFPGPFSIAPCGECKTVILPDPKPDNNFTPDTRGEVELAGIQDLLIVRQTLLDYHAGEISHIENILEGEKKGTTHRKLSRTELTTVQETEKVQEVENELQTTDKYELQSEASRTIQDDRSLEAGVTVTASYGPVNIEAHGNYATANSTQESRNSASTFARDVLSRSLQRIRERVLNRLTRTEITEVEITNLHEFDNTGDNKKNISGIYRWVDKFYEAQIANYGKRMMLEFMVPEPSAFYKYALTKKPVTSIIQRPEQPGFCRDGIFYLLSPADLQVENYMCFVGKYNVKNVTAPSPRYLRVSDILKYKIDSTQGEPVSFAESNDSFKIPEGYAPKGVSYTISGGNSHSATTKNANHDDIILVMVTIADRKVFRYYKSEIGEVGGHDSWPDIEQVIEWGNPLSQIEQQFGGYSLGNMKAEFALPSSNAGTGDPDVVKVSLTGHTTLPVSVTIHYSVLCERTPTKFQQWQIDTFNAIMDAYENLKANYDDAQQLEQNAAVTEIQGRNPLLNREVEKRELKKYSISILTGQQYDSFNAMEQDYQTGIPQISLADAAEEGRFVRFFEQALEWKNVTYILYPYFWGNKRHWAEALMAKDDDPLFEQFLQAGYARVWVPVRPGFESVMLNYIECGGEPWSEKDAPIIGQPGEGSAPTLAMIDEIKEQLGADFEFRPGTIEVQANSTLVTGTGTDFRPDDTDREILIALKYYRIASVDETAQQIRLREPYRGSDQSGLGYAIGVKFVGEPWVVQVPTTLVHLRSGSDLIDT